MLKHHIRAASGILFSGSIALGLVACQRSGVDDERRMEEVRREQSNRVDEAQQKGAAEINAAQMEAQRKIQKADEHADKQLGKLSAEFDKSRTEYANDLSKKTEELDKKIAKIEDASRTATGKKKAEIDAALPDIRARRQALGNDVHMLDSATAESWAATKNKLDTDQKALSDAIDNAPFTAR